ncbi:CerR family C-terminal domain-containing protein [Duganella sp. LX20W]|uniref:CerR family C-terminal domain-containing protein n=2 Tax=Rugamonas brunnea TaxID=2758569 RepID=A0A7W2IBZ5_9BURK|nr:CerR family C-terminal domain-containing protein [Rugamonas brunnea]
MSQTNPPPHRPPDDMRKPRSDGEQSRERLRLAAMRLFAEQGYARTSTREIAQAAGANVAAISYYFGDKAGLYRAVFEGMCPAPEANIAQYDQAHFTLREALLGFYRQMLAPLQQDDGAQLFLRLWLRERLEPTGLWAAEIDNSIRPEHMALVRVLCRHLNLEQGDDEVHRLAYALAALAVQIMVGRDIVTAITPQLLATPAAIEQWLHKLARYGEALVVAEQINRKEGTA